MAAKLPVEAGRGDLFRVNPNDVKIIGLDTKDPSDVAHPLYDKAGNEAPISESFIENLRLVGQIAPVRVAKISYQGAEILAVESGRQRTKALRELNKRLVSEGKPPMLLAVIVSKLPEDLARVAVLSENTQRKQLTTLELAEQVGHLIAVQGMKNGTAAVALGVKPSEIQRLFSLYRASADVKEALKHGALSVSAALALASGTPEQQREALAKLAKEATETEAEAAETKAAEPKASEATEPEAAEVQPVSPRKKTLAQINAARGALKVNARLVQALAALVDEKSKAVEKLPVELAELALEHDALVRKAQNIVARFAVSSDANLKKALEYAVTDKGKKEVSDNLKKDREEL